MIRMNVVPFQRPVKVYSSVRGLVISVPLVISGRSLHLKINQLDPQELRFSLLFWDKLDYPMNNGIMLAAGPDAQFLEQAGILTRTMVPMAPGDMAEGFRQCHLRAFEALDRKEPGCWSIATGERSISFLDHE